MTKYILHGGRTGIKSEDNKRFFNEIVKDVYKYSKIILIYFARDEEEWEDLLREDRENYMKAKPDAKFEFLVASKDTDQLINQILESNIVHIRGGETKKLLEQIRNLDLKALFKNKVVVGSSAGAYVLSRYYYNNDNKTIEEGLGILPVRLFCHYTEDQESILKELKNHGDHLKTHTIPEQRYIVL